MDAKLQGYDTQYRHVHGEFFLKEIRLSMITSFSRPKLTHSPKKLVQRCCFLEDPFRSVKSRKLTILVGIANLSRVGTCTPVILLHRNEKGICGRRLCP